MALPQILQQLSRVNRSPAQANRAAQIKDLMNAVATAKDPQAFITNIACNNPELRSMLDAVKESGGSPKAMFYKRAQEMGVNPDDVLNFLK